MAAPLVLLGGFPSVAQSEYSAGGFRCGNCESWSCCCGMAFWRAVMPSGENSTFAGVSPSGMTRSERGGNTTSSSAVAWTAPQALVCADILC